MTQAKATLTEAKQALAAILDEIDLLPDKILDACRHLNKPLTLIKIPQWSEYDAGADIYTEHELFKMMFHQRTLPSEKALIVTDESFISGCVWFADETELEQMLRDQKLIIFDGDIIFLWPKYSCLSLFHHEGFFAHIGW